jgi:hypothetical protein
MIPKKLHFIWLGKKEIPIHFNRIASVTIPTLLLYVSILNFIHMYIYIQFVYEIF